MLKYKVVSLPVSVDYHIEDAFEALEIAGIVKSDDIMKALRGEEWSISNLLNKIFQLSRYELISVINADINDYTGEPTRRLFYFKKEIEDDLCGQQTGPTD